VHAEITRVSRYHSADRSEDSMKNITITPDEAMRSFLSKKPIKLRAAGQRYPTRDESNDRAGLRR